MKVFISWSGDASRVAAEALNEWLPSVLQAVDVFFSAEDIDKGAKWFQRLDTVLEESRFAILCLTPENAKRPWILYEAGAISKSFQSSRIAPLLLGVNLANLPSPLNQFNAATTEKQEVLRLVRSINSALEDKALAKNQLDKAFEKWWPDLEGKLLKATQKAADTGAEYDVFLSTPMAGFETDAEYGVARGEILKVYDALQDSCGYRVFWGAKDIVTRADFDTVDVSAEQDLRALDLSRVFALIYPRKLVTSALFEAGYALAKGLRSHYFVRDRNELPFLMRELPGPFEEVRIHDQQGWTSYDDLAKKVVRYKDSWFG